MDLREAERLARTLMGRHGLGEWSFRFSRARRAFGTCIPSRRIITLSAYLTHLNSEAEVRDTILHEIAHALEPNDGHGEAWKEACRKIGARPDRLATGPDLKLVHAPLKVGCSTCNWWADRHRVTWREALCKACRNPVVWLDVARNQRFVLVREGRRVRAVPVQ
jgi:predicted SprT family Zn-dependent metalloprotease